MFISGGGSLQYEIKKSLRFRGSASPYLNRTPSSAGNRRTWTLSVWVKRGDLSATIPLLTGHTDGNNFMWVGFNGEGFIAQNYVSANNNFVHATSAVFRDPSAWYHVVYVFDSTQATASNRGKLYINGVQIALVNVSTNTQWPTLNYEGRINATLGHYIGFKATAYADGYLAEYNLVDGQALDPSYFGKIDATTGQWVAKKYTGSYGTCGIYLDFKDGTNLTTLGNDKSNNGNNWTLNNVSLTSGATYDWMDDTPTNNFCTLNPLDEPLVASTIGAMSALVSNGNLTLGANTTTTSGSGTIAGTMGVSQGKFYFEGTLSSYAGGSTLRLGFMSADEGTGGGVAPYKDVSANGTYMVAVDFDNLLCWVGANGVWDAGDPNTGTGGTSIFYGSVMHVPFVRDNSASSGNGGRWDVNFGQQPFAYTPPSGFKALCTKNLPTPTILNGRKYFDVVTGTGSTLEAAINTTLPNKSLRIVKNRSTAGTGWVFWDEERGATARLDSSSTSAETTFDYSNLTSGDNHVAAVCEQGVTPGFDIVSYAGTGVARTIAHNLGVAPSLIIIKDRDSAGGWAVYHKGNTATPETDYLLLQATNATSDDDTNWNDTAPTSSVFSLGTATRVNQNGNDFIAYLFAEVPSFSKFGSYTGNGNAGGPFIYCGFKPRWVLVKRTDNTGSWVVIDTARDTYNVAGNQLYFNQTTADGFGAALDIVSNGFKIRSTATGYNTSGGTYIFWAMAECPFKYATAR